EVSVHRAPGSDGVTPDRRNDRGVRPWIRIAAVGGALLLGLSAVATFVVVRAVQNGKPACADATFGSSHGPVRQSPLSGIGGTGARLRAALGRARGEVAYCNDFADPFVLRDGRRYYAYSTQSGGMNVPVMRVAGLFDSGKRHDALPRLPTWS